MKSIMLVILLSLVAHHAGATAPIILSKVQQTELNQEQCLQQAEQALKQSGFSENLAKDQSAVWGMQEENSGHIRCVIVQKVVLFVVAGKLYDEAGDLFKQLYSHF